MVHAAMKDPRNLSPNSWCIITALHSGLQIGEVDTGLGAVAVQMHQAVVQLSGGNKHASTLVYDHAKANPALYKQ
eukprot:6188827-Pleurochrysis_carterae.AAC.1